MNNKQNYPLQLEFKLMAISPQFTVVDANFQNIAYIKQKAFKFKEDVRVFKDESQTDLLYTIKADRWLDWSASYKFADANGKDLGRVARKGAKSIFKAHYELYDEKDQQDLIIEEDNAWVKVADSILGEIPVLNFFTGYFFNPKYNIKRPNGTLVAQLSKQKSLVSRKFKVTKMADFEEGEEQRILLGLMMMVLLERSRG